MFDLLDPNSLFFSKAEGTSLAKPTVPARVPIQIRETVNGGITLAGVTESEVRTKEEMATYLSRGSQSRATGSTNMNSQSRCNIYLYIFLFSKCFSPTECGGFLIRSKLFDAYFPPPPLPFCYFA